MSRRCPECAAKPAWALSDGRWKCRRCGTRYRYRTAWDAQRISSRDKNRLLEFFVLGVPAYRLRFRMTLSPSTVERFYRIARLALARDQGIHGVVVDAGAAPPSLAVTLEHGRIGLWPLQASLPRAANADCCDSGGFAQAVLEWHGERPVLRRPPVAVGSSDGIENFWSFASHWLHSYRGMQRKNLPLYLAEICFRYNHREQDLFPLVNRLLRTTPLQQIAPGIGPERP